MLHYLSATVQVFFRGIGMAGTQSAQHSAQSNPMRAPVASKESEVRTNEDEPHEYIDVPRPLASLEGTLERGFGDVVALLKYLIGVVEKLSGKSPVESAHSRAKDGHEAGNMQVSWLTPTFVGLLTALTLDNLHPSLPDWYCSSTCANVAA